MSAFAWLTRVGAMGFAMRATQTGQGAVPASVGIDLGTAFSRVALWRDGDVLIIPNDRGKLATPSCVAFTEQSILVGEAAQEQADGNLDNTIFAPQRLIGNTFDNPWVQWYMRSWPSKVIRGEGDKPMLLVRDRGKDRTMPPEEIVTMLLAHLRKMAEQYLGVTVMDAVITVPACYGRNQREALLEACRGARLNVLDLVKAPTAAAIAYSLTNPNGGRRNVLVCDMGASYFDFSLLSIEDGNIAERAIGTEYIDLDNCIERFCIKDLREKFATDLLGQQVPLLRLRRACEAAKRRLSQYNQARVEVNAIVDGVDYVCNLSRGHFEELCKFNIEPLLEPINWCLEDSGLEKPDVHEVVLVGGSARVPRIRRAIREFFYGKVPREVLRPDHAAVLGAAAYVAVLNGDQSGSVPHELSHIKVRQVTSWPFGAAAVDNPTGGVGVQLRDWRSSSFEEAMDSIPTDGAVNSPNRTKEPKGIESIRDRNDVSACADGSEPGRVAAHGPGSSGV